MSCQFYTDSALLGIYYLQVRLFFPGTFHFFEFRSGSKANIIELLRDIRLVPLADSCGAADRRSIRSPRRRATDNPRPALAGRDRL